MNSRRRICHPLKLLRGQPTAVGVALKRVNTTGRRYRRGNTTGMTEALPDIPTVSDFLPGYEASFWGGFCAPKDTPVQIVDKLNSEINVALADPKIKARLADLGATALPGPPTNFGKLIADETEKWGKVVKFAGMKPE
jgi:tripartite-type tricarboxylate transporter receptor subunit TctC